MPAPRVRVTSRDGREVANAERALREAILNGEISPGQVTSQVALGDSLQAGRTPIREALRLLEREGLVVSSPNRRVRIAQLSGADAEDLYVMRIALEATAVRLTVPRLTSAQIAELEGLLAQTDHFIRERDRIGMRSPHRAFHLGLTAAIGERGRATISVLFDHSERYRLLYGAASDYDWTLRSTEHRALLDAAISGDGERTVRVLGEHYAHTARLIFAELEPDRDVSRLRDTLAAVAPGSENEL